ncbi:MAG: PaaI family thioesterase [Candidatus Caldatribacteriota bacterium]|nr:PaaI family thioesterase [Candidatus Caldatribacteriota bacterium]
MEFLSNYKNSYVCGKENPIGLKIKLFKDKNKIKAEFIPESKHEGYIGIVHGGILFSIMDEIMSRTAMETKGVMTLTVEINIKYRKRVKIGEKIIFSAEMTKDLGKMIETEAQAYSENETLLVEAKGKFIVISKKIKKEMDGF